MTEELLSARIYGDAVIVAEMPLLAMFQRREIRSPGGLLDKPPKLFVVCYSPERDATTIHPVEYEVAETLAPRALAALCGRLGEVRAQFHAETQARRAESQPTEG